MREAVWFSASIATLFFVGALCSLYWVYSRGALDSALVMRPLNLKSGSKTEADFTVRYRGDHDVLIWYPRTESMTHCDDLSAITGTVKLRRGEAVIMELALPVRHRRFESDGCGILLSTGPMGPELKYSALFEVDHLPESLANLRPILKIDRVPEYNSWFLSFELLGAGLLLAAVNAALLSVRLRRVLFPSSTKVLQVH